MWYLLGARIAWLLLWRIKVIGKENIPSHGPLIIVVNHQSFADGILLGVIFLSISRLHFFAKKQLFKYRPIRWILKKWNLHPIKREGRDIDAVRLALQLLEQKHMIVVIPEGHRSKDGVLQKGKEGAAYLATKTGVPVLPIGVERTGGNLLKILCTFPRITIRIGMPITVQNIQGDPSNIIQENIHKRIMYAIAVLLPYDQRGVYSIPIA